MAHGRERYLSRIAQTQERWERTLVVSAYVRRPYRSDHMDTNTLLIIVLVVLLLGGGGFFYSRRGV